MGAVHVFEVSSTEFWASAGTPEEVLVAYQAVARKIDDPAPCDDNLLPRRLTETEMDELFVVNDSGGFDAPAARQTFREYLDELIRRQVAFPRLFATLIPPR